MSSAIEWSLGLPCADQRDAILASVVEGPHAPSSAAAAEHLRRCPACRAFRDSLRTQRVLVRRVAEQQQEEKRKKERQRQLKGEMTEWVEQELRVRGERELALAMWRCAYAMLRLDPSAAQGMHHEFEPGRAEDPVYSLCVSELQSLFVGGQSTDRFSNPTITRHREEVGHLLRSLESSRPTSRSRQIEVMHVLLDLADQLSIAWASPIATTRALIAWFHGEEREVRPLLIHALDNASSPVQRGHAVANLALWYSSNGSFDDAIALGSEAIHVSHHLAFPRANLALWTTAVGKHRQADRYLGEAAALVGVEIFHANWPWPVLRNSLDRCLTLVEATARDRNRAVDSMWIAYHRSGGLIPSRPMKQVSCETESNT